MMTADATAVGEIDNAFVNTAIRASDVFPS